MTPEAIAAVETIMKENPRVTVHEIPAHLDKSHGSAHHIVHEVLQFHKMSAGWVPRQLTAEMKEWRVDACQELLKHFEAEGDGFLGRNVTGNETWVHYHQLETKKASKEWRHTSSPKLKKFCTQPSADSLFGWTRGNFGALHAQGEHCDQCNVCNVDYWVQVFCCNMAKLGPILHVQLLQQSKICPLSVFHIHCTHQTLPQVIFTSLDHWKRRWEASLSVRRRGAADGARVAALSAKRLFFFFSRGIHALPKRWNTWYGTQWRMRRKMMSLCTLCVQ